MFQLNTAEKAAEHFYVCELQTNWYGLLEKRAINLPLSSKRKLKNHTIYSSFKQIKCTRTFPESKCQRKESCGRIHVGELNLSWVFFAVDDGVGIGSRPAAKRCVCVCVCVWVCVCAWERDARCSWCPFWTRHPSVHALLWAHRTADMHWILNTVFFHCFALYSTRL